MKYYKFQLYITFLLFSILMWACSNSSEPLQPEDSEEIIFQGLVENTVSTRANTSIYDVKGNYYPNAKFHIYVSGKNKDGDPAERRSRYVIPSGSSGILLPFEAEPNINWLSRREEHNIWSWSIPWDETDVTNWSVPTDFIENVETGEFPIQFESTDIRDALYNEKSSLSGMAFIEGSPANGIKMKQILGAVAPKKTFVEQGQFVELQYRHLVSLILLADFVIVDNSTSTSSSTLKGNITLYGLPTRATFHTTPVAKDGTPLQPYIEMEEGFDYPPESQVTFAVTNYSRSFYNDTGYTVYNSLRSNSYFYDEWYICPEVDLSRLSFKIEIFEYNSTTKAWQVSRTYGENGAFYGDFKNIEISRTPGSNYDADDGTDDSTILHAGEFIMLAFNLSTKGNASVRGTIVDWSQTTSDRTASNYDQDGIYSIGEMQDFSAMMNSGDRDKIDEYFGVYGSGKRTSDNENDPNYNDDLGIFELYEDIGYTGTGQGTTTGSSAKMPSLYVADDYILDGMGHMVNFSTSAPKIGHMRDIYLRYYSASYSTLTGEYFYYEYIVYIGKDGQVYTVDPVTYELTDTDQNLNDFDKNPLSISLSTGKVS